MPIVGFLFLARAAGTHQSVLLLGLALCALIPLSVFVALFTTIGIDAVDVVASVFRTSLWQRDHHREA
jgi:hypothetical protein